ncbi:MAG: alpha/beta hydrolase fold domain-containing protein [Planctomycetota bacterium]
MMAVTPVLRAAAELRLPAVFTDHAVLQRDRPVPVWGQADAGVEVVVQFADQRQTANTDAKGRWRVTLDSMSASTKPQVLQVQAGNDRYEARDVLVGDVWLCSGQSNMDWRIHNAAEKDELLADASDYAAVRFLKVGHAGDFRQREDVNGQWQVSGHEDTVHFSAVAFSFARRLHDRLDVPVGVLQASIGGTGIWAWTDPAAMRDVPALGPHRLWLDLADRSYAAEERLALDRHETWAAHARALADANAQADLPDPSDWPTHDAAARNMPGAFHHAMIAPLAPYALRGFAWYQGEHNVGEGELYARRLEALLDGWRTMWDDETLPALIVHLPPYAYGSRWDRPDNALPWLVEAQRNVSAQPNNVGIVISDLGNLRDIHPRQKRPVGERMADRFLAASGLLASDQIEHPGHGPVVRDVSVLPGGMSVRFDATGDLRTNDDHSPTWFTLAGEDGVFHPADAILAGNVVLLSSDAVPVPVAMRFAFDEAATPNLTDATGLPAMAHRIDDWPEPMTTQQRVTLPLWPDGVPMPAPEGRDVPNETTVDQRVRGVSEPSVELFFPRGFGDGVARPAVLVFPGGGYGYLTIEKEGKAVARRLNEAGIIAGVVKHRVSPYRAPAPWFDGTQAVRLVRTHADRLGIDPQRIGVLGFSAGGHVAAMVSVEPDSSRHVAFASISTPELGVDARPDFTVLVYPVISMRDGVTHLGSRKNLFGVPSTTTLLARWSADERVNANTPPAFVVHCANDGVSIRNSELYVAALEAHGIPHVFARYDDGGHGFGLGGPGHPAGDWSDRVVAWIENLSEQHADANP